MKPTAKPESEKETFIDIKDDHRSYVVSKCKECESLFWTRKDYHAVYCSKDCQKIKLIKSNGLCKCCRKQVPRCCPNGIQFMKRKFCSRECAWKVNRMSNHNSWKGGTIRNAEGYKLIKKEPRRYILEHRLVMENHIGRKLIKEEVVHHINKIRTDNRIENLILFKSSSDHIKHHRELERESKRKN